VSPRLPRISGDEATRALERAGFRRVSQRGSHLKLRTDDGRVVIIPLHRELATGTLRSIIRQSAMTVDEFLETL
jgi:predicted RNA binding protein YcfA (HicA-like mRNA interferase family)